MYKLSLVVGMLLWLSATAQAQLRIQHQVGFQKGLLFNNITNPVNIPNVQPWRVGFMGGMNYRVSLNDICFLEFDLLYGNKGYNHGMIVQNEINPVRFNFHCILMPLKFGSSIGKRFKFSPKIGIQPSVCVATRSLGYNIPSYTPYSLHDVFQWSVIGELEWSYAIWRDVEIFVLLTGQHDLSSFSDGNILVFNALHRSICAQMGARMSIY